jgi:hypothetical protein
MDLHEGGIIIEKMARTHLVSFTDTNARAAREGRKTRTRRHMNPQPQTLAALGLHENVTVLLKEHIAQLKKVDALGLKQIMTSGPFAGHAIPKAPYAPGDVLLARESHRICSWDCEGNWTIEFRDGGHIDISGGLFMDDHNGDKETALLERLAHYCTEKGYPRTKDDEDFFDLTDRALPWRPARFMWAKAVRSRYEVVSCTPTRLNDITPEQAIAEGIEQIDGHQLFLDYRKEQYANSRCHHQGYLEDPIDSFKTLWESIHGHGSWERNEGVWDIEFRKMEA